VRVFSNRAFRKAPIAFGRHVFGWFFARLLNRELSFYDSERHFFMSMPPLGARQGVAGIFINRRYYEPAYEFLETLIETGDNVIDCGANVGAYTIACAAIVGSTGVVVAVEPREPAARLVRRSAWASGLDNVRVTVAAIADTVGTAQFDVSSDPIGASIVHHPPGAQLRTVPTVTVDHLVERFELDTVALLKLDVEGAEHLALKGAAATLAAKRPVVVLEVWNPDDPRMRECEALLRPHGYGFYVFADDGMLLERPGLDRKTPTVVCLPPDRARPAMAAPS